MTKNRMPFIQYDPESYWDDVALRIRSRKKDEHLAGDAEPYYIYKRKKFLALFRQTVFRGKKVLEIGSGPGGNLLELAELGPSEIVGTDLSQQMVDLAKLRTAEKHITVIKTGETVLPFRDQHFDLSFTSSVLQHITSDDTLDALVKEICQVTKTDIYIFERIEKKLKRGRSNTGRTITGYEEVFNRYGFRLQEKIFLHIHCSALVCGMIRKLAEPRNKREGAPPAKATVWLQIFFLPFTRWLDSVFRVKREIARLHFTRFSNPTV